MKTFLSLVVCICLFSMNMYSQPCVPVELTAPGFHPDSVENLPNGVVNQYYSTVISALIPTDTVVIIYGIPTTVQIDSIEIIKIEGLPNGLSWQSDSPNNRWKGGTKGCVLISGTPTIVGTFPIDIIIKTKVITILGPIYQTDTIDDYRIIIEETISIEEFHSADLKILSSYPNPTKDCLNFKIFSPKEDVLKVEVFNLLGASQKEDLFDLKHGMNYLSTPVKHLTRGIYLIKFSNDTFIYTHKIVVDY